MVHFVWTDGGAERVKEKIQATSQPKHTFLRNSSWMTLFNSFCTMQRSVVRCNYPVTKFSEILFLFWKKVIQSICSAWWGTPASNLHQCQWLSFSSLSVAGRVAPHAVPRRCCGKIGFSTSLQPLCSFELATFAPTSTVILCCHIAALRFLPPVCLDLFLQWNYSRLLTQLPASALHFKLDSLSHYYFVFVLNLFIKRVFATQSSCCWTFHKKKKLSWIESHHQDWKSKYSLS